MVLVKTYREIKNNHYSLRIKNSAKNLHITNEDDRGSAQK